MQLILPDNMCHTKIVLKIEQPNGCQGDSENQYYLRASQKKPEITISTNKYWSLSVTTFTRCEFLEILLDKNT